MVCTGNYKKLHVRISGRRNCLGGIIGERSAKDMRYISGKSKAFAVAVNSNTHTGPDYRLPPCAATHDASCNDPACQDALNAASGQVQRKALIRLCKAAQRAARQTAGYFFGYTFKGQPVGRRALQLISQSFDYLSRSLQMQPEHRRFQRTATRTMVDFHHSTTSRRKLAAREK